MIATKRQFDVQARRDVAALKFAEFAAALGISTTVEREAFRPIVDAAHAGTKPDPAALRQFIQTWASNSGAGVIHRAVMKRLLSEGITISTPAGAERYRREVGVELSQLECQVASKGIFALIDLSSPTPAPARLPAARKPKRRAPAPTRPAVVKSPRPVRPRAAVAAAPTTRPASPRLEWPMGTPSPNALHQVARREEARRGK